MTHLARVQLHLTGHPGWCDDCLSNRLSINPRQTVNGICSKAGSGIVRTRAICACCGKQKVLNHLGTTPEPTFAKPDITKPSKHPTKRYVREEDLRHRFNASLIETLNLADQDYYGRLDFDHLLRLKEGLARIHDIVTLKLTFALVDQIARRFGVSPEAHAALYEQVNATHPNTSGFDIDWAAPNLIAEVKGCIPVNGGNVFGAAQVRGLTNDVRQMLGHPSKEKDLEKLSKNNKINRLHRAEAIKLLGLYDSPTVRTATEQWRQNLLRHSNWKPLAPATIEDLPVGGKLTPSTVYLIYLKPAAS